MNASDPHPLAVEVTVVSLRISTARVETAIELLDADERARASERSGPVRVRFVAAHAAARIVLAERLGTDPARVVITAEPRGRPIVAGAAFSLSHSSGRAAIAVAPAGARIGIDIERIRAHVHLERLAQRVFDAEGRQRWVELPPRSRARVFARRWTELEALLKARGTGIAAAGLTSAMDVLPGWARVPVAIGKGYVGTVAADRAAISVTNRSLDLGAALTGRDGTAR